MSLSRKLNPDALLAFDALVRTGSFTKAAELLGCAKSRISQLIKDLERELGTTLVLRDTRRTSLTEAGERLSSHAHKLNELLEGVYSDIEQAQEEISGLLRISAIASLAQYVLPDLLLELTDKYPRLTVELLGENQIKDPVSAKLDFCFRSREIHDERLVAKGLGIMRESLYASPQYLQSSPAIHHPADLSRHKTLFNLYYPRHREWELTNQEESTIIPLQPKLICDQYSGLLAGVLSHYGITSLPDYIAASYVRSGQITPVLDQWSAGYRTIFLVYPYRHPLPRKYEVFIDFIRSRMEPLLYFPSNNTGQASRY